MAEAQMMNGAAQELDRSRITSDSRRIVYLLLALIGIIGTSVVLYVTRNGPSVGGDSVHYIQGARSLLEGNGYSRISGFGEPIPLTGFPPMFSASLALLGIAGLDAIDAARWLNSVLFGINLVLLGLLVFRSTRSWLVSILVALFILVSPLFIRLHLAAMSEPLFYTFMLLAFHLLLSYLDRPRIGWVIAAGFITGLSILTRFVGVAIGGLGILAILVLGSSELRRRIRDVFVYAAFSFAPMFLWMARNAAIGGSATNRIFKFNLTRTRIVFNLDDAARWILSEEIVRQTRILIFLAIFAIGLLMLSLLTYYVYRRDRSTRAARSLALMMVTFIFIYLAVFAGSASFLDATMKITTRYMSPLFLVGLAAIGILIYKFLKDNQRLDVLRYALVAVAVVLLASSAKRAVAFAEEPGNVFGFFDQGRANSAIIASLDQFDSDIVIYTDEMEYIYILTGRTSFSIPQWYNSYKEAPNEDFPDNMEAMHEKLRQGGILVVFSSYDKRVGTFPARADLINGLEQLLDAGDGRIYVNAAAWPEAAD